MIKEHYSAIKRRLTTQVPALKIVDWFMQQYTEKEGEPWLWQTPAAFIEFQELEWETLRGGLQRAEMNFAIHLVTESFGDSDAKLYDAYAVDHFALAATIHQKMMNFRALLSYLPEYAALANTVNDAVLIESLVRDSTIPIHQMSNLMVSVHVYKGMVYDYGGVANWATVMATLNETAEIVDAV